MFAFGRGESEVEYYQHGLEMVAHRIVEAISSGGAKAMLLRPPPDGDLLASLTLAPSRRQAAAQARRGPGPSPDPGPGPGPRPHQARPRPD